MGAALGLLRGWQWGWERRAGRDLEGGEEALLAARRQVACASSGLTGGLGEVREGRGCGPGEFLAGREVPSFALQSGPQAFAGRPAVGEGGAGRAGTPTPSHTWQLNLGGLTEGAKRGQGTGQSQSYLFTRPPAVEGP